MPAMLSTTAALRRCASLLLALGCAAGVAACGHHSTNNAVGVGVGIRLTAPAGSTLVEQGATLEIDAAVSGDPTNQGVSWLPVGACPAATSSPTKCVYQAPTGVVGALTVTLTATAVADATQVASVTITVNGTPVMPTPVLFPANLNVGYVAYFTVVGGLQPFTYSVTSGTVPAGLTFDTSTTGTTALSGIPTALGSSTFSLQAVDANGVKTSESVTLVINPQTACVLIGRFAYLFTGFRDQLPVVRAGSLDIASDGTISGEHDYMDDRGARIAESLTDGTCTTASQNRGALRIVSPSRVESFDFGTLATLSSGQMQENDSTPIVGSGQFFAQDASAFTLASVAGDYTFGLIGSDAGGHRLGLVGRFSVDSQGVISTAAVDTNQSTPLTAGAMTGTLTAPDANGRGTALLSVGGLTLPVAYYVVNANTVYLVSSDPTANAARLAGRMTRQVGAGTLSATTLAGPAVLSLWGSTMVGGLPTATVAAGLLFNGTGGTLSAGLDGADRGTPLIHTDYVGMPYAVAANGRGTVSLTSSGSSRDFVLYLSSPGNAYVLEPASVTGNWGILDAQSGAPYTDFLSAYYAGGTVFATSSSPITLVPQIQFQQGSMTGNVTGSYAIDPASGRAIANVSRNILGGSGLAIYVVSARKLVVIGDGVNSVNSSLAWLQAY
jgi:putative Ig domain-containing protein